MNKSKIYITLNSVVPRGFIGWKQLALKLFNELDCIIVHESKDLVDSGSREINSFKDLIKENKFLFYNEIKSTPNDILIILEPYKKNLIPKNFEGKIIASLCGYDEHDLLNQLRLLNESRINITLSEILPDELNDIEGTTAINQLSNKIFYIPSILFKNKNATKNTIILYNKDNDRISNTLNEEKYFNYENIFKVLDRIDGIDVLNVSEKNYFDYDNISSYRKIINLTDYPKLDFESFIYGGMNGTSYFAKPKSSFSPSRHLLYDGDHSQPSLNIDLSVSVRENIKNILNLSKETPTFCDQINADFFNLEFIFQFINEIIHGNDNTDHPFYKFRDFYNNISILNDRSSNVSNYNANDQKFAFKVNVINNILNKNTDNLYLKPIFFRKVIQILCDHKICSQSVNLMSTILEQDSETLFNYFTSLNNDDVIQLSNLIYYSLLIKNNNENELLLKFINLLSNSQKPALKLLIPRVLMLAGREDESISTIRLFIRENVDGIKLMYHLFLKELLHPSHNINCLKILKFLSNEFDEKTNSDDIKEILCLAGIMAAIDNPDKGYQLILNEVKKGRLSKIYITSFLVSNYCFSHNSSWPTDGHQDENFQSYHPSTKLNMATLYLLGKKIEAAEEQFNHLIASTKSIFCINELSIERTIPFILYARIAGCEKIFELAMNITNLNSIDFYPDHKLPKLNPTFIGNGKIREKVISFLS